MKKGIRFDLRVANPMQKWISIILLAGMCPQSLSDTGLSALEAK